MIFTFNASFRVFDGSRNSWRYSVYIGDDDTTSPFQEVVRIYVEDKTHPFIWGIVSNSPAIIKAVIAVYSKRNLPVAQNICLAMRILEKDFDWMPFEKQLLVYDFYVEEFSSYRKEVIDIHERYNRMKVFS